MIANLLAKETGSSWITRIDSQPWSIHSEDSQDSHFFAQNQVVLDNNPALNHLKNVYVDLTKIDVYYFKDITERIKMLTLMPENTKYCCALCQQPIPTGKEIKIVDYLTSGSNYYNFSNRRIWDGGGYYSYPYAVYYLCPPCFRSYQRLQKKRTKKAIILAIFIVVFVVIFILLLPLIILSLIRV